MMTDREFTKLAGSLGDRLAEAGKKIAVAESCTGGWIAKVLTDNAGSSAYVDRGFVTYSNEAKMEMLGVRQETLDQYGAVSVETALEMAKGALKESRAQVSLAVSGIAGPGGATPDKPVGTVCLAWALSDGQTFSERVLFSGDREEIRRQTVEMALTRCPIN